MPDADHIETDWQTLVAAKAAYSVSLFEKGLCRVFAYEGRRYTTTTKWKHIWSLFKHSRDA